MQTTSKNLLAVFAALAGVASLNADVIDTTNGARLVGKITKIDGGAVTINTSYAGDIKVKQDEIAAMSTDEAVAVRLESGTRIDGVISTENGALKITGSDGVVSTSVGKVSSSWKSGGEDPQISAMRRKWSLQTTVDIAGKTGNTKSTAIGAGFVAGLSSPQDALKFYGSYQYATTTDLQGVKTKSADETKAGIDYASFFTPRFGWFVRSELERDDVEGVELRSTSDFGATVRFVNKPSHSLVGRLGVGYRFESYPFGADNKGAVLTTGLTNKLVFSQYASLVTDLSWIPSINDFADYRFVHDSALEVPISAGFWKLRIGVNNQFNSTPLAGREELDTTYYTRLILNWR